MNTLYVPLEEVEKFLIEQYWFSKFQIESVRELPTIDLSVIDEMIEENKYEVYRNPKNLLQELKARLSPKK